MNIQSSLTLRHLAKPHSLLALQILIACCLLSLSISACSKEVITPAKHRAQITSKVETAQAQKIPEATTGTPTAQIMQVMPQITKVTWILDGTDLVASSDVKRIFSQGSSQWAGSYRSEQGGSILDITITPKDTNNWRLDRDYSEPGLKTRTKSYNLQTFNDGLASTAGDLAVQKTSEGVLVLELKSDVDSIPASYWVHYFKAK